MTSLLGLLPPVVILATAFASYGQIHCPDEADVMVHRYDAERALGNVERSRVNLLDSMEKAELKGTRGAKRRRILREYREKRKKLAIRNAAERLVLTMEYDEDLKQAKKGCDELSGEVGRIVW